MKLRTQLFLGYVLVFGLMLVTAIVSYRGFTSHTDTTRWVAHTHEVISNAHLIEKLLSDMENGHRGFLLTGEDDFLEPYNLGREAYQTTMLALKALVTDNPAQVKRLAKVERLVAKWQKIAAQPEIEARRKVSTDAVDADYLQAVVAKGVGKGIQDTMREIMDGMIEAFQRDGHVQGAALTEAVAKAMVDGETGQRGFLITGHHEFLAPFWEGTKNLTKSIAALRNLVGNAHDRIATVNNLDTLEKLASTWLSEAGEVEIALRRQVDAGRKTQKDIERVLTQGLGKNTLDQMRQIMHEMDAMFARADHENARVLLMLAAKAMVDQETGQRGFIITGKDVFLEPFELGKKAFGSAIETLRHLNANAYDIPSMKRDIRRLEQLAEHWLEQAARPQIAARELMNRNAVSMKNVSALISAGTGKSVMDALRVELATVVNIEEALLRDWIAEAERTASVSTFTVIFGTLAAVGLGVGGMLYTSRNIQRQVGGEPGDIAEITARIAQGNLDVDTGKTSARTGIFASVQTMVGFLKQTRDKSAEQDWVKTGQNLLNKVMRGDLNVGEICDNVIGFLADYLQAQIGALYIAQDTRDTSGMSLALTGSFAFTKRDGLHDTIPFGEGLLGQVAVSKKMMSVTALPDDYTRISSATGDAVPANLVVVPLSYEGTLIGVIEIGALAEFSDTALEFLEGVSDAIAIGIYTAQSRLAMGQVLDTTKEQADVLQSQQEALELANRELETKTQILEEQKKQVEGSNAELERTRAEMEKKAEDLARASQYKSEFLANMSHELRTPLNSLLILASSLAKNKTGNLRPDQVERAEVIQSAGEDLLGLINDILDLAKVESGKLDVLLEDVLIQDLLDHIGQHFSPLAQQKGVELHVEADALAPNAIRTDGKRVEQILRNLASNAFKFTDSGSVTIRMHAPESAGTATPAMIAISVSDTGIGIPPEQQQSIFAAFQQADGTIGRRFGGTGLGLSISRELSRLLGGRVELQSEEGRGSTFTLMLPIAGTDAAGGNDRARGDETGVMEAPLSRAAPVFDTVDGSESAEVADHRQVLAGTKILVVDDDMRNTFALSGALEEYGSEVVLAGNGGIAIDALEREENINLVVMDIMMPIMDGYEAIAKIRQSRRYGEVPIVALTAMASSSDRGKCMDVGASEYLTKPIDTDLLVARIEALLESSPKNFPNA